jgi:hypothetical protein
MKRSTGSSPVTARGKLVVAFNEVVQPGACCRGGGICQVEVYCLDRRQLGVCPLQRCGCRVLAAS